MMSSKNETTEFAIIVNGELIWNPVATGYNEVSLNPNKDEPEKKGFEIIFECQGTDPFKPNFYKGTNPEK